VLQDVADSCAHRVSPETQGPFIRNNDVTVFGSTMAGCETRAVYNRATASGPLTGYRQRLLSFHHLYTPRLEPKKKMNICEPGPTQSDTSLLAFNGLYREFCRGDSCSPHQPELIPRPNRDAAGEAENSGQTKRYLSGTRGQNTNATVTEEEKVCGVMYIHSSMRGDHG
jgi:hypothetical protein